jgi:FkbM family methyltransferase
MAKAPVVVTGTVALEKGAVLRYREAEVGKRRLRYALSNKESEKRIATLLTKEPTTITWMNSFTPDDVFFDVGGNVGMYTVYAAAIRGCKVYAFEPEALNYAELNKNIFLNGLYDRVRAFCCAVTDQPGLSTLYLSAFTPAFSHHDFRENAWRGNVTRIAKSAEDRPRQGCIGVVLDNLVAHCGLPCPNHVKVDVDGFESRVVEGMLGLLGRPELKSVQIETDFKLPESVALMTELPKLGWRWSIDQVRTTRLGVVAADEMRRRIAGRRGGANVLYYRDERYEKLFSLEGK